MFNGTFILLGLVLLVSSAILFAKGQDITVIYPFSIASLGISLGIASIGYGLTVEDTI